MLTTRLIDESDVPLLEQSLSQDEFHKDTKADFFIQNGTITKVYSDENGPIIFARATKCLRLDLQFVDNNDFKRNLKAMIGGFTELIQRAKDAGFTQLVFNTENESLRKFCATRLGFEDVSGWEMRKFIG